METDHIEEPVIAALRPAKMEVEPGIYAYCTCGVSSNQPFCDGSHMGTAFKPILVEIEERRKISWCTCKHSLKQPICDGTHKVLKQKLEESQGQAAV